MAAVLPGVAPLAELAWAPPDALACAPGVGIARASVLAAAFELGRRAAWSPPQRGDRCLDPGRVHELMRHAAFAEKEADDIKYGLTEEEEVKASGETMQELSREKRNSLYLILGSVFLWFIGYNAVTTKLSDYAPKVLGMGYSLPLLIAQGAARLVTPDSPTPAPSLKPSRRDGSAAAATSTGD